MRDEKPGWVEFPPVWGRRPVRLVDGYSPNVIAMVFNAVIERRKSLISKAQLSNIINSVKRELEIQSPRV